MTLSQALAALHRAGRIRSPWLPGMHSSEGWRVLYVDALDGTVGAHRDGTTSVPLSLGSVRLGMARPDTSDAATCGCLLALLREAHEAEHAHVFGPGRRTMRIYTIPTLSGGWAIASPLTTFPTRDTEGAAIEAALIALAEAIPSTEGGG